MLQMTPTMHLKKMIARSISPTGEPRSPSRDILLQSKEMRALNPTLPISCSSLLRPVTRLRTLLAVLLIYKSAHGGQMEEVTVPRRAREKLCCHQQDESTSKPRKRRHLHQLNCRHKTMVQPRWEIADPQPGRHSMPSQTQTRESLRAGTLLHTEAKAADGARKKRCDSAISCNAGPGNGLRYSDRMSSPLRLMEDLSFRAEAGIRST